MARERITISLALIATTMLLPAAPASRARQKSQRPRPGQPKNFVPPALREFTLPNGLAVTLVPFGTVPWARVVLSIRAGNGDERADEVHLADLTGDFLQQGTRTRKAEDVAQAVAGLGVIGGALNVEVTPDETIIGGQLLGEFVPEMVRLIGDIAKNPAFPESQLARLKANQSRQHRIRLSQSWAIAAAKFDSLIYPNHPYGRSPSEAMLQGYTLEQVRRFHTSYYSPARARLYVVGLFESRTVEKAAREAFGDWERQGGNNRIEVSDAGNVAGIHIIDRPGAAQSRLHLGMPVASPSHPDYIALVVTDTLIGRNQTGRIPKNVCEAKGYSYNIGGRLVTRRGSTVWTVTGDVATDVTGAALKEILHEINRLQAEPPRADELLSFQNYLAGRFVVLNSTGEDIIKNLQFIDLHGLDKKYLSSYVKRIYAVTPEEVQRVARTYLRADRMPIIIVGDRKKIAPQVAPHGKIIE